MKPKRIRRMRRAENAEASQGGEKFQNRRKERGRNAGH